MGLKTVDLSQGSPEWVIWRMKGIGASSAAAVLGECKFKTAYDLFLELTNRKPPFEGNAATERGQELEGAARAAYEIDQGFVEAPPVCIVHPEYDFLKASLDGWIEESKTILEIKCPSEASHKMAQEGEVPRHYWIQCQHQLMCAGVAKVAHYWSFRGSGVKVNVLPDLKFQKKLLAAEIAFWELVKSDIPPPLTERDAKLVTDGPILNICQKLKELKNEKSKAAKELADDLKSQVIDIGGHNKVRCGDVLVSRSITKTGKESFRLTIRAEE